MISFIHAVKKAARNYKRWADKKEALYRLDIDGTKKGSKISYYVGDSEEMAEWLGLMLAGTKVQVYVQAGWGWKWLVGDKKIAELVI